jgi:two-component system response regulator AtoC
MNRMSGRISERSSGGQLNLVIIEADPSILAGLKQRAGRMGFNLYSAAPYSLVDQLAAMCPDLAILGPSLNRDTSVKCIHKLKIIDPVTPILTSCYNTRVSGGSTSAPFEGVHYLSPDPDLDEFSKAIENALAHKAKAELWPDFPLIIGQSRKIKGIRKKIQMMCDKDIPVLITGETGTGKELIARSIHCHSLRSKGPLVKISCRAMSDDVLKDEFFGFQMGAITSIFKKTPGHLEVSNRGTLFIDEIENLSLPLQGKLLQELDDNLFSGLGGTPEKIIDTRVVATTKSDLWKKVREGSFRKDVFYRLNMVHIKAPALREIREDIPLLTDYFLNKYCFEFKRDKRDFIVTPDEVVRFFRTHQWPGNVSELENVIRQVIIHSDWNIALQSIF